MRWGAGGFGNPAPVTVVVARTNDPRLHVPVPMLSRENALPHCMVFSTFEPIAHSGCATVSKVAYSPTIRHSAPTVSIQMVDSMVPTAKPKGCKTQKGLYKDAKTPCTVHGGSV